MSRRITIIEGHPDPRREHFGYALADAYAEGARQGGHGVRRLTPARLEFPLLRTQEEFEQPPPPAIAAAQEDIRWADHLVFVYPLWMGDVPAVLKGFLEQVFRPGFAMEDAGARMPRRLLKGRSARIVVTMGMPAAAYRWLFGAHSVKSLKRSVLGLTGIGPVRTTLIGLVEGSPARRERWLRRLEALGRAGR